MEKRQEVDRYFIDTITPYRTQTKLHDILKMRIPINCTLENLDADQIMMIRQGLLDLILH